jgi:uncharacterized protein YdeI (YjbR/CyaY-like superfamily)
MAPRACRIPAHRTRFGMATRKKTAGSRTSATAKSPAARGAPEPTFFPSQAAFGKWLEAHHVDAQELWVGFHKKATGKPSLTWNESVDEALRFGWIDGIRKTAGADAYTIRFTPRRAGSIWSDKNIKRMHELIAAGVVAQAGLDAFERRKEDRSRRYSFEQPDRIAFPPDFAKELRANREAWAYWEAQPPYYRKTVTWWVISAKREATRRKRFDTLVGDCAAGRRIAGM